MKSKKLNLGSGTDYREGFINLDFNKKIKADVYADASKRLPFEDDVFNLILIKHCLEHFQNIFEVIEEIHRIAKTGATIEIYVPHFSSPDALKLFEHYQYFGLGSFGIYTEEAIKRQYPLYFKVKREELRFVKGGSFLDFLFNFGRKWKYFVERFNPFGFSEIYYELEVIK